MIDFTATILVVDDNAMNRDILIRRMEQLGHATLSAENGQEALDHMNAHPIDLVLLDIMMPVMNGYEVLEHVKSNEDLRHIPVLVISANDQFESVIRCIEMGAEDYLTKPFNRVLLQARVRAALDKKKWHDTEKEYLSLIESEREKSDQLLRNILPDAICERLKGKEEVIADSINDVSVLFADIVGFSTYASTTSAEEVVDQLNEIFSRIDSLVRKYNLEKIKTIGDEYMIAGGLTIFQDDHLQKIAQLGLEIISEISTYKTPNGQPFEMRVGIATGKVVAGIIGEERFSYDLWGETVNLASRMQSQGKPGHVHVTWRVKNLLEDKFNFSERGPINVKGIGVMNTFLLDSAK